MKSFETLKLEDPAIDVLLVRFDRPQVANALNTQMGRELLAVFSALNREPGETRCVIITGTGDKAFCAGGDLKERNGMSDEAWIQQHRIFENAFAAVMECPLPVIAAVNGAAFGGGFELALSCDFIYAARGARFALTETRLGIIPGCGGTQNLTRAAGMRRAKEMILSATACTAEEAHEWGIVNKLCEPPLLMTDVLAVATRIAANAPFAVRQAKHAMDDGAHRELKEALRVEIEAYDRTVGTDDRREGVAAFNEKRAPRFSGH